MAQFPRTHNDVITLANNMITGIGLHPEIFPDCQAAVIDTKLDEFDQAAVDYNDAYAEMIKAAKAKQGKFNELSATMKKQLKFAQIDTVDNPVGLNYIGMTPRRKKRKILPPHQPGYLSLEINGEKPILRWIKSAYDTRHPVKVYMIQTRIDDGQDRWQLENMALSNSYQLTIGKPDSRANRQFRIIAVNDSGSSMPSNSITVII